MKSCSVNDFDKVLKFILVFRIVVNQMDCVEEKDIFQGWLIFRCNDFYKITLNHHFSNSAMFFNILSEFAKMKN